MKVKTHMDKKKTFEIIKASMTTRLLKDIVIHVYDLNIYHTDNINEKNYTKTYLISNDGTMSIGESHIEIAYCILEKEKHEILYFSTMNEVGEYLFKELINHG